MNTIYNKGAGTVCILDNRTTAMTGQQGNPFNGVTLQNRPSRELNLPAILEALGVDHVQCVDAFNMKAVRAALKNATQNDDLDVIVFQGSCVLLDKSPKQSYVVTPDCTGCGICKTLGCPLLLLIQKRAFLLLIQTCALVAISAVNTVILGQLST